MPAEVEGPAKAAMDAFKDGRHAKAVELATPLAENGNAEALYLLGFASESGQGAEASKEKALEYYRKAAAGKHKDAIYRMSFILLASEKEEERDQAREALESAAKDDPAVAARILGEAYLRGLLTPTPDPDKAVFWWKRAADAGDVLSVLLVARFYEGQFGFPELQDNKQAFATYAKAAGLGDTGAMNGHGPPATVEAIARAAASGLTTMLPSEDSIAVGDELRRGELEEPRVHRRQPPGQGLQGLAQARGGLSRPR